MKFIFWYICMCFKPFIVKKEMLPDRYSRQNRSLCVAIFTIFICPFGRVVILYHGDSLQYSLLAVSIVQSYLSQQWKHFFYILYLIYIIHSHFYGYSLVFYQSSFLLELWVAWIILFFMKDQVICSESIVVSFWWSYIVS